MQKKTINEINEIYELEIKRKVYKLEFDTIINMNPSDPQGLLDEFFLNSITNFTLEGAGIYG